MSTVIYLSNRDVKAVVGTGKNGRMTVTRACRAQAPDGSIINGQVINEEAFDSFLSEFWEENELPRKDVVLVLGSSQAVNRVLQVPKMSHRKLMDHLPREFATAEERKDPAFGYVVLGQEGSMVNLAATMIDRSYLEPHLQRFKNMGIKLNSVVSLAVAEIMSVDCLSYIKGKTCIIQGLDGMSLTNILYVNGAYFQYNSSRIFGERGTPAFGIECARSISNMQQFLKTQQVDEVMTHVYLGGEFQDEDVEICRESIQQMDDSLDVEKLYEEQDGAVRFQADGHVWFENFIMMMGGLLAPRGKSNLFYQYSQDRETVRRHRELLRYVIPVALAAFLLGGIGVAQAALWFARTEVVNRQFDYLDNQLVIERAAEYDRLVGENAMLDSRIGVITKTVENLNSYPVYTSQVKQAILECAAGVASADVTDVDLATGTVSISASSGNAEGAHQFVDRLEARTDLFQAVFYDGFQFDEKSGLWKASVKGYLTPPENGLEEVTP